MNYYNENDPKAAQWLRDLIWVGAIPDGEVDIRSIEDVIPNDIAGFTQCHFFAGIGGWPLALGLAGWPVTRPVWTGSCPCQPFSQSGKGAGFADERHLWPAFFHLITQCRPPVTFGEQVAGPDGLAWLDLVQTDLQGEGYTVGAADLCAASVGSPQMRQRLYWVADADSGGRPARSGHDATARHGAPAPADSLAGARLGDTDSAGLQGWAERRDSAGKWATWEASLVSLSDGTRRPAKPGIFPLADGIPARVGLLRGYGNAIVPQVAAEFIGAYRDTI